VASTNMTFDVAIWFAPADAHLASSCAWHLVRHQLRVTLIPCNPVSDHRHATGPKSTSSARMNVAVIGHRGASVWIETLPTSALWVDADDLLMLFGPGLDAGTGRHLQKYIPGRVWDLRFAWEDDLIWNAVGGYLSEVGCAREAQVEARSSLIPAKLQRMTICSYDAIAEQFSDYWFDHPPQCEIEQFLQRLAPNSSVLDVGCGPGHHAKVLANAGHDVVGIDLSDGMLTQARQRVPSIGFLKMDMKQLQFSSDAFDAVWCSAAVHHIPREQILHVLRGFRRVLKPGGLLGLNLQVGRRSEVVERQLDRRFFEYYNNGREIADFLGLVGFMVEWQLCGKSRRNTYDLDIILEWSTLYARSRATIESP